MFFIRLSENVIGRYFVFVNRANTFAGRFESLTKKVEKMAVIDANDTNFQSTLQANEKVVVKYFAGWCGSCRLMKPKFKRLSDDDRFKNVAFLDVNAEESPEARKLAGVSNLPFFAVFKNGELVEGVSTSKEDQLLNLIDRLN